MPSALNLVGWQFGRLTVQRRLTNDKHGKTRWVCLCSCGETMTTCGSHLTSGTTKSCGCLKADTPPASKTHGLSKTPEYLIWGAMKARCLYPKHIGYKNYGGRGIKICPSWQESFENFLADMGKRPSAGHTLDRLDNEGDYEPGNCRWSTRLVQRHNRREYNMRLRNAAPDMLAALLHVRSLITEAAMTGFNWKDGDWVERLFASQAVTSAAIFKATRDDIREAVEARVIEREAA